MVTLRSDNKHDSHNAQCNVEAAHGGGKQKTSVERRTTDPKSMS
jgi:hypothetical protein